MFKKIGIFIIFALLAALTINTMSVSANDSPFNGPDFPIYLEFEYCFSQNACNLPTTLELRADGSYSINGTGFDHRWSYTGSPEREITFSSGDESCMRTYVGEVRTNLQMSGTFSCADGSNSGQWRARKSPSYP